jgi:hypothetical protein
LNGLIRLLPRKEGSANNAPLHKHPRTQHISGSGLQPCDDAAAVVLFRELAGQHLVVEEEMDGADCERMELRVDITRALCSRCCMAG